MRKQSKIIFYAGIVLGFAAVLTGTALSGGRKIPKDFTVSYEGIKTADITAGVSVHDPSVIEADGTYYIFGSHMSAASSEDLRNWTSIGDGYTQSNPIFDDLLGTEHVFDYTGSRDSVIPTDDGTYHVWAPDVVYNRAQDLYYMYFCTSSTWNASNLCYAVSDKPEGPYTWKGALIYSGFTKDTIEATDVLDYVDIDYAKKNYIMAGNKYNYEKYPNAIDPTVFYDADGKMWMVYGSWSGGIFLLEIDEKTGLVIHPKEDEKNGVDPYFGKRLLGGGHKSIEGPYILYDEESGYYYLPGLNKAYMATGHNSAFVDEDGKKYIVYHTRFDNGQEYHEPRVHQYFLNQDGWPCMLPYATDGETIAESGYGISEVAGTYYVIDQGTSISARIAQPVKLVLMENGNVYGENLEGTWSMENGTCYMTLTYGEKEYNGVFCQMKDEAGTDVMTFSAVGANESVWGVKYFE